MAANGLDMTRLYVSFAFRGKSELIRVRCYIFAEGPGSPAFSGRGKKQKILIPALDKLEL